MMADRQVNLSTVHLVLAAGMLCGCLVAPLSLAKMKYGAKYASLFRLAAVLPLIAWSSLFIAVYRLVLWSQMEMLALSITLIIVLAASARTVFVRNSQSRK